MKTYALSAYLQRFFTERLGALMKASPNTVASYRDTFRLLLRYTADQQKKEPTALQIGDIDAELVANFLTDLEKTRGNGARSRNTRLAAIRSFYKYVAVNEPQLLHHCQRVLAMPAKRHEKRAIDYLDRDEIEAVIAAPDLSTWHGRRDRAILMLTLQTGLRVTELITLTRDDIALGGGAHVTKANALERRNCIDTALINRMSGAGYAYMHLIFQMNAANKLAATAFAEGQMTKAQYEAVTEKNLADMRAAEAQLIAQDQQRKSEAWARFSQSMQQQQMIDAMNRPAYTAPTNTHCRPDYMGGMNCTTF